MTRENYAAERMYRTVRPGIRIRERRVVRNVLGRMKGRGVRMRSQTEAVSVPSARARVLKRWAEG